MDLCKIVFTDVTAAILVYQNNDTAAMLVIKAKSQSCGSETFFCS